MASRWPNLNEVFSGLLRSNFGTRLGPGVLKTVASMTAAGFVSIALIAWALSAEPWLSLIAITGMGLLLYYLVERTYRYAEENPVPALLSGGELGKLSEHQTSASDKSTITDDAPLVGAQASALQGPFDQNV